MWHHAQRIRQYSRLLAPFSCRDGLNQEDYYVRTYLITQGHDAVTRGYSYTGGALSLLQTPTEADGRTCPTPHGGIRGITPSGSLVPGFNTNRGSSPHGPHGMPASKEAGISWQRVDAWDREWTAFTPPRQMVGIMRIDPCRTFVEGTRASTVLADDAGRSSSTAAPAVGSRTAPTAATAEELPQRHVSRLSGHPQR